MDKQNTSGDFQRTSIGNLTGGKGLFYDKMTPPPQPPQNPDDGPNNSDNRQPELVSSDMNDVLSHPPSWLVQWGTTLFFLIFFGLIGITWFVQYPDLVNAPLKVAANNLPKTVNSKTEGQLTRLFVKEGQQINQGDLLAYLESTASHDEVMQLEKEVNLLIHWSAEGQTNKILNSPISQFFKLGELQKSFQAFQESFVRSQSATNNGIYIRKKSTLENEIAALKRLGQNTLDQLSLQEKDLTITLEEAQSQQRLSEKGFVSQLEAKNAMSKYLGKKQAFEQNRSALENNRISQLQKQQEIIEIEKEIADQRSSFAQSLNTLKSEIEAWKQRYVALAPASGKINFLSSLQENQIVKNGQELLYILPEGAGYYGEMYVGQYNFGKVKNGQEVIVKFQSYPFQEFGTVKGEISFISDIPKDSVYLVKVSFPKGLLTSSNKNLPFRNGMTASGEIITENLRLIEKFFYEIRKSVKR